MQQQRMQRLPSKVACGAAADSSLAVAALSSLQGASRSSPELYTYLQATAAQWHYSLGSQQGRLMMQRQQQVTGQTCL